jgi:hypothetical protein
MAKTPSSARAKETKKLRTSLVESAFDFLERAVGEHDSSPKYAILHLATSVELFLKARLMAEHWALIISPKQTPTFDRLKSGDFISVNPDEAIERINGVLPKEYHVSKDAQGEFASLAQERNKVAHFFHADLDGKAQPKNILQRQCRVWLHLHRLLDVVWRDAFSDSSGRLAVLNRTMRGQRRFLKAVFDSVKPELDALKKQGSTVLACQACGFTSLVMGPSHGVLGHTQCKVCAYGETVLLVDCPECGDAASLSSGGDHCACGHLFSPDELANILKLSRPGEMDHAPQSIHCPWCYHDDVFPVEDEYVCLNCFASFEEIGSCEWCSTLVAGGVGEESNWRGCGFCEGYRGHVMDRD